MTIDAELPLVPVIPEELKIANARGILIPFVGAGASRLAGCPGWAEFADGALKHFVATGKLDHAQLAQLNAVPARVKLSLAHRLNTEHGPSLDYGKLLHPAGRASADGLRLYGGLSRLGTTFVTTNYDEWLDEHLAPPAPVLQSVGLPSGVSQGSPRSRQIFMHPEEMTAANLASENTVLHLHGSVRDTRTMVMTTRDYIRHYRNDRTENPENPILTFLDFLFDKKHVLFVGYGLEELEILEYVILKSQPRVQAEGPRHFMLQGYFSHERALMREMKKYYREFGIELLPYLLDAGGFRQLLDVIDEFAARMPATAIAELQMQKDMRAMLNEP